MNPSDPPDSPSAVTALARIDQALAQGGPSAAIEVLIAAVADQDGPRALLDALLLRARHDLGMPALMAGPLGTLPPAVRDAFEQRYIEAVRLVGTRLLDRGDVLGAWPYFRLLGEREPVAAALEAVEPGAGAEDVSTLIEIALGQGAHPRRGYELVLAHYGICPAITAFEQLPEDEAVRAACAAALIRALHEQLAGNLRGEIARRGEPDPPAGCTVAGLVAGRDWLFDDEAYHVDVSHLAAAVRLSPLLDDPEALRLARGLAAYGSRLDPRHRYPGEPPFDDLYAGHAAYLDALLGVDVESNLAHFEQALEQAAAAGPEAAAWPAQVLVRLLDRLGRVEEAIAVARDHLGNAPEGSLFCPTLVELCRKASRPDLLAAWARERGDLVRYTAALLQGSGPSLS
jgi:hypothetical protein